MRLKDWDWDAQHYVEREYPDALIAGFMDWLRTTKAWRENPYLVSDRLRKLELDLNAYRAQHPRPSVPLTTTTTEQNVIVPLQPVVDDKKARQLANLAKGRAARAAKLAAAKGG